MKLIDLRHLIRQHRQSQGMSAESLANQSKTTKSNVLNFENGKANLTLATLGRIMETLNLEVNIYINNVTNNK